MLKNYRPIALLSVAGMVLEKIIALQIEAYFVENKLIGTTNSIWRSTWSKRTQKGNYSAVVWFECGVWHGEPWNSACKISIVWFWFKCNQMDEIILGTKKTSSCNERKNLKWQRNNHRHCTTLKAVSLAFCVFNGWYGSMNKKQFII